MGRAPTAAAAASRATAAAPGGTGLDDAAQSQHREDEQDSGNDKCSHKQSLQFEICFD